MGAWIVKLDNLVKSPKTGMPALIPAKNGIFDRHSEVVEFAGFRLFDKYDQVKKFSVCRISETLLMEG